MPTVSIPLPLPGAPDATNPPTNPIVLGLPRSAYAAAGSQKERWRVPILSGYASGGVTLKARCAMATATTGTAGLSAQVDALGAGDAGGTATLGTAVSDTETVPGTAGVLFDITLAGIDDSLAAGDDCLIELSRPADTAAGDLQVVSLLVEYVVS